MWIRSLWRRICSLFGLGAFVVLGLNIERVAEATGLDSVALVWAPSWAKTAFDALQTETALYVATIIAAYTAGLWTEWAFRTLTQRLYRPVDREALANTCERTSRALRAIAPFATDRNYMLGLELELYGIEQKFEKLKLYCRLRAKDESQAMQTASFLDSVIGPLRQGDIDTLREIIAGWRGSDATPGQAVLPQLLPDIAGETPLRIRPG
jgi:hypothetical protein